MGNSVSTWTCVWAACETNWNQNLKAFSLKADQKVYTRHYRHLYLRPIMISMTASGFYKQSLSITQHSVMCVRGKSISWNDSTFWTCSCIPSVSGANTVCVSWEATSIRTWKIQQLWPVGLHFSGFKPTYNNRAFFFLVDKFYCSNHTGMTRTKNTFNDGIQRRRGMMLNDDNDETVS